MSKLRTLRLSRRAYQAEIVAGLDKWGGEILIRVEGKRTPEVDDALATLESGFTTAAGDLVNFAAFQERLQEEVRGKVGSVTDRERTRIEKAATERQNSEVERLKREVDRIRGDSRHERVRALQALRDMLLVADEIDDKAKAKIRAYVSDMTAESKQRSTG